MQFIEIGQSGRRQEPKCPRVLRWMVAHQLAFQQLEEEQAVHPHQAQGEGHFFALAFRSVSVIGQRIGGQAGQAVANIHLVQDVFQQGAGLALGFRAAPNLAHPALLLFFQTHQVQQLVVKLLVQGIGIGSGVRVFLQ